MDAREIYADIAGRTGGDIYIGVVGPVRCGKSTFIKRFMETSVIPNISGDYDKKRATDELPQSAGGKTVMTTEPKFVPDEAVNISFGDSANLKMRMIDCVGYMVPEALGATEEGETRMVNVPWAAEPVPFETAAEEGTRKVITEHSTVGMLVTCDGSFGEIPRESFEEAEERIAAELHAIGKPFAIILNSKDPGSEAAEALAISLEEKYDAPVALVNCTTLDSDDVDNILEMLLYEFPLTEIEIRLPSWIGALPAGHALGEAVIESIRQSAGHVKTLNDVSSFCECYRQLLTAALESEGVTGTDARIAQTLLSDGTAIVETVFPESLYYSVICDLTGICVKDQRELVSVILELSEAKRELEKYEKAIDELEDMGYGIVSPEIDDLKLCDPEVIRQSGAYGVKLKATAASIHMIRADIETEISPIVGTEEQSEEMIRYLMSAYEEDPKKLWESNMFGKSLYEMVNDGLHSKLEHLSAESREKLSETLARIVNESSNGLVCILL